MSRGATTTNMTCKRCGTERRAWFWHTCDDRRLSSFFRSPLVIVSFLCALIWWWTIGHAMP